MKKKKGISTALVVILVLAGLGLILYPTVSDMYATWQYNKEIEAYNATRAQETAARNEKLWADAEKYNRDLLDKSEQFSVSSDELERVEGLLNPLGNGMMGYVNIPKIDVALPIYQGTDEKELQSGAGWWIGSSLPTGGESTHCIITAHTGLSKAKLFTDLDQLELGDRFTLTILDRTLEYEVDQILVVVPTDYEPLYIVEGEDYVTLYTCTPYGVNTHRLLVRGARVDAVQETAAEAGGTNWLLIGGGIILLAIIAGVVYFIMKRRRKTAPAAAEEKAAEAPDPPKVPDVAAAPEAADAPEAPEAAAAPKKEDNNSGTRVPNAEKKSRRMAETKRRASSGYVGKHCAPQNISKDSARSKEKQQYDEK